MDKARPPLLRPRKWTAVQTDYDGSAPYNFAVLDGFLEPEVLLSIRKQLIEHWGWHYKNWIAEELYVDDPDISEVSQIADEMSVNLPELLKGFQLVKSWAFMYQRNAGLDVHADDGAVTLDLWLTPDQYNLDPETGGLRLFNVKRTSDQMIHEFNTVEWAEGYLRQQLAVESTTIPYQFNRAVLFDASTFHESDTVDFVARGAETFRINLSLLFDDPEQFSRRRAVYDDPHVSQE